MKHFMPVTFFRNQHRGKGDELVHKRAFYAFERVAGNFDTPESQIS
jgi:hypothetical protein